MAADVPDPAADASAIEKGDVAVAKAVAPYQETLPVKALNLIGKLGDQPPMRLLCGATLAFAAITRDARLARTGVRMLAAHSLATGIKTFIKHRVDRTRPQLLIEEGRYDMGAGESQEKEQTSFPSGHTAGAVAVARAFAREYPEHKAAAHAAAAVIALAQIPRCTHYASDVGAGAAIGFAAEAIASNALDAVERSLPSGTALG